jgi:uncharacterized protein (DUF924 family)
MYHVSSGAVLALVLATAASAPRAASASDVPVSWSAVQSPAVRATPAAAAEVVAFWRDAGPGLWFAKDPEFDRRFRERFLHLYDAAVRGELRHWAMSADSALALVILLDQFPRNAFRGSPRMYASDDAGRAVANAAIANGFDRTVATELQLFFYLPFAHSESLIDQDRSVELVRRLGQPHLTYAEHHRDIIRRFGRFPHRNPILGRSMTPEEQNYLENGGFKG